MDDRRSFQEKHSIPGSEGEEGHKLLAGKGQETGSTLEPPERKAASPVFIVAETCVNVLTYRTKR